MSNVVDQVVLKDRCSSCGVCVGLCPAGVLSMSIQQNGDLVSHVDVVAERCLDKCHLCLDICPFLKGLHSPRERNTELYSHISDAKYNEDIGWYTDTYVGYRVDETLRRASASGGLLTWCLEYLLAEGIVTRVAVVRFAKNHEKRFFEFYATSSVDELRRSSGSIYHPIEISAVIKEICSSKQERWAIVGVPCLCAAIRNSQRLQKFVRFVFGLACGMYQNIFYTEMLLAKGGTSIDNITNIEYRRKSDDGQSSDHRFRGTDDRGPGKEIPYQGLPFYLGEKAYFRQNACNYCMDVFAETADACFMDAWLPEYRNEPKGTSHVIVRNSELRLLFQQGVDQGGIYIKEIDPEQIVKSQSGHVRRKRELIFMRLGIVTPDNVTNLPTTSDKIIWWMQKLTQERSKKSWANFGRRYGRFAFWLTMTDILLIQYIIDNILKIMSLPKRVIRTSRRILIR